MDMTTHGEGSKHPKKAGGGGRSTRRSLQEGAEAPEGACRRGGSTCVRAEKSAALKHANWYA